MKEQNQRNRLPHGNPPDTGRASVRGETAGGVPATRHGRVVWMTVAVLFLALVAIGIWLWVHTEADDGHPVWPPHRLGDTVRGVTLDPPARLKPEGPCGTVAEPTVGQPMAEPMAQQTARQAARHAARHAAGVTLPTYPSPFQKEETTAPPETEGESPSTAPDDDEIIYRGRRNDRMEIALSFDDGPHPYYTPIILDILSEYNVRATFFMVGENVTYYPAAAEAVVKAGHEIGNHTFSHKRFGRMSEHELIDEIAACEDAISSVAECRPHFIRPPEGQLNETMRRVIGALDYRIVLWDVDTRDWAHTPPETICTHILDTVQAGDIILMHDFIGHDSPTPEALRLVIPALLERGYHFVTVGELVDGR